MCTQPRGPNASQVLRREQNCVSHKAAGMCLQGQVTILVTKPAWQLAQSSDRRAQLISGA